LFFQEDYFAEPAAQWILIVTRWRLAMAGNTALPFSPDAVGIVSLTLENAGTATLGAGVTSFGQLFAQGELPAGTQAIAWIGDAIVPVQLDVKTTWPDGSIKMAVVSLERPALAAGASVEVVLAAATTAVPTPAIDLVHALEGHAFTVEITPAGGTPVQIDVLAALQSAIAAGTASVWQSGALATEARVEVLLAGSQRLLFDVTAYKGGGFSVDVQFNNDRAMEAAGGRVSYGVTVNLDGQEVAREQVDQGQYQNWHRGFSSNGVDGGQGLGEPDAGWLNIRHDVARLSQLGAIADYDLTIAVPEAKLAGYATAMSAEGWGDPLATNGVTQYMPMTGGRADIGYTTQANTVWLLTQDARAAGYALGQAETAGAVPWNFWNDAADTWLNTDAYPRLWTDARGGTGTAGLSTSRGLTQQVDGLSGWTPDRAHQPDLSYVPYLLTGERWILDNLNAQAAYNVVSTWPDPRGNADDIVVRDAQVRTAAWSLRQIDEAAWIAPDGSAEKAYFTSVSAANWGWLVSQIPTWTVLQGEAHGWLPGAYGTPGAMAPWQQDYFASTAIAAASRGNQDALTFLEWMSNFLVGRFQAEEQGFGMHDGVAYNLMVRDPATGRVFTSWAEIEAATVAHGQSNGTGWAQSNGNYGRLGLATLAGIYHLTGSEAAAIAYRDLLMEMPPGTSDAELAQSLDFLVTIPGVLDGDDIIRLTGIRNGSAINLGGGADALYLTDGANSLAVHNIETIIGGAGADKVTLATPAAGAVVDLGAGLDTLILGGGTNSVTVSNAETITGGAGNDTVRLATAAIGAVVNLGAGNDQLILANVANTLTVSNVETILGGTARDDVTLTAGAQGVLVDLGAGDDRLILAGGNNTVTASHVETLIGGSGNDKVTLAAPAVGMVVDLGAGIDTLILGAGTNSLVLSNVETVTGGAGDDAVTLATTGSGLVIDLGGGADRITLASNGPNSVTLRNIETIIGGAGDDTVKIATGAQGAFIDLGAGYDRLTLLLESPHTATVSNVESIIGGLYDDVLVFGTTITDGVVDLVGGYDRLTLADGTNSLTVRGVDVLIGGSGADTVWLSAGISGALIDLGAGKDVLTLADGYNNLTIGNVETLIGGSGGDRVTLATAATGMVVDLGAGADTLILANAANSLVVNNAETITGGTDDDSIWFATLAAGALIDLGAGADRLFLANGANTLTARGVESIIGGTGNDAVTLGNGTLDAVIDLGTGDDRLILGGGTNSATVSNVETITGGTGSDTVVLGTVVNGVVVDLLGGSDRLVFANGTNILTVSNVETITGGTGNDRVTLAAAASGMVIDLGAGNDVLILADGNNSLTVSGVEILSGGAGNDKVTLAEAVTGRVISLGGGQDTLILANGTNTLTAGHVETITGGSGDDAVRLGSVAVDSVIDLGGGNDQLILANGVNTLTARNIETITGGTGADVVTLGGTQGVLVDLGAGYDRVILGNGHNSITLRNVEAVTSGYGNDTVTLEGVISDIVVDLGGGSDQLVLAGNGNNLLTIRNTEIVTGGAGSDTVTVGTSVTNGVFSLGAGFDRVVLAGEGNSASFTDVELVIGSGGADRLTVTGGTGAYLFGNGGADTLVGGAGADTLQGGIGADVLTGGAGADRFVIGDAAESPPVAGDRITDFLPGTDLLVLPTLAAGGGFAYLGTGLFSGQGKTEARFIAQTQQLLLDMDGDGLADIGITLSGVSAGSLAARDFVWA
jgi:Ca2+-binding RTX toxin-like protein